MKRKSDEAALEPVVDGEREHGADVRVHRRLVVAIDQIQEATGVVGEAAAVRKIADEADARPARRRDVLIDGAQSARLRQPHDVAHGDGEAAFDDGRFDRVRDLRVDSGRGDERDRRNHNEP